MKVKLHDCQFKVIALIIAWLWRRQGYETTVGKVLSLDTDGETFLGYFISGNKRVRKKNAL